MAEIDDMMEMALWVRQSDEGMNEFGDSPGGRSGFSSLRNGLVR